MHITIQQAPLRGRIQAPLSKAWLHRALIAGAFGDAPVVLQVPPGVQAGLCEDARATVRCLRALGAQVAACGEGWRVVPTRGLPATVRLDCGQSAATLRFLLPVVAAVKAEEGEALFVRDRQLAQRPLEPLLHCLEQGGARIARTEPLRLGGKLRGGAFRMRGDISSQFFSGLCLALPLLQEKASIIVEGAALQSGGFLELTREVLRRFGVDTAWRDGGLSVGPGSGYHAPPGILLEGAWDSAAPLLVAGALGGPVTVGGLRMRSLQPDQAIVKHLRAFGARVEAHDTMITVAGGTLRGAEVDVSGAPDLAPCLAVLGAFAQGETRLKNTARLRYKESDRAAAILRLLRGIGVRAWQEGEDICIAGRAAGHPAGGPYAAGARWDCAEDHRIIMAAAIAASMWPGKAAAIPHAEAVSKSYPGFFSAFRQLGGKVYEQ